MKLATVGLVLGAILLTIPGHATAKMPWHTVEIAPATPVAGEPINVVVRFWNDATHTIPSTWWPDQGAGTLEFRGVDGRVPLQLIAISEGAFRTEATLSEGTWHLMAVLHFSGAGGRAEAELAAITVAARSDATAPISAAIIGVALVTAGIAWRGRRSSSANDPEQWSAPTAHHVADGLSHRSSALEHEPDRKHDERDG